VAEDYFTAMSSVEKRLDLLGKEEEKLKEVSEGEWIELLALTDQLLSPKLSLELCLEVATQIRMVLQRLKKFLSHSKMNVKRISMVIHHLLPFTSLKTFQYDFVSC
jgi:hypothetical protein